MITKCEGCDHQQHYGEQCACGCRRGALLKRVAPAVCPPARPVPPLWPVHIDDDLLNEGGL